MPAVTAETSRIIDAITQALESGDLDRAHILVTDLQLLADQSDLPDMQAQVCYWMARVAQVDESLPTDWILSLAVQSADQFRTAGNDLGEASALSLAAMITSLLGMHDEAVEHATLAVRLTESLPEGLHTAQALNYLGVATMFIDGSYTQRTLLQASVIAHRHGGPGATAHPLINLIFTELYRLELCLQTGEPIAITPMARASMEQLQQLLDSGIQPLPLLPGLPGSLLGSLLPLLHLGLAAFEGRTAAHAPAAHPVSLQRLQRWPWLHVIASWIQARSALSSGDPAQAARLIEQTAELARQHRQARIELIAQHMRAELHERCGRIDQALVSLRQFRWLLLRQESIAIASRERMAQQHVTLRRQNRHIEILLDSSRHLERLSLEDPLTGLANRRRFEQFTQTILNATTPPGSADAPWCLVMIDIDHFKRINDAHTHVTGDEVLRQIAMLLRSLLDPGDLAARLAGDEFVLVLPGRNETGGQMLIERLHADIQRHDWEAIQPGLRVGISCGLAEARADDTLTSLLRRSDMRMYADKMQRSQCSGTSRS